MTGFTLFIYRMIWRLTGFVLPIYLRLRAAQGKEIISRLPERYGYAAQARPKGRLYWLHGVSVGETVSSLVLAEALLDADPEAYILITSGTVTSAEMARSRISTDRIIHQFHPHDHPKWVRRFLKHWQPDLVVMMESEIWPNMIVLSHQASIPVAMASAQISPKSLSNWQSIGRYLGRVIFPKFDLIAAADKEQFERFAHLIGHPKTITIGGSMKAAATALPDLPELKNALSEAADGRHVIFLASSHEGEDALFIDAINAINLNNEYFAVIAPRHIQRGSSIRQMASSQGDLSGIRSKHVLPSSKMSWWIADAMGEMGALIRAADVIVLGGGFEPLGGHNPMEMASLGKGVISGKNVFKNKSVFSLLDQNRGVIFADTSAQIAEAITLLTSSPTALDAYNQGAVRTAQEMANAPMNTAQHLLELIEKRKKASR